MKILQLFNRYSHMGGEELAVEQISAELAEHHEFRAITFDSQQWANETGIFSRARQFVAMAYNPSSIEIVRKQIEDFRPDMVLLHNIMPIGSAGLYVYLSECGVPCVHYVHNFRPFSINGYCWGKGKLLPQGLKKNFLPEILAGSWQNSSFKTAWYGILIYYLHWRGVYERIDGWIAISNFMKSAFIEGGMDGDKIRVISHSWQPRCSAEELENLAKTNDLEPSFLFLGRLTEEKGIRVLLDAWEKVEQSSPTAKLVIAGDGPLAEEITARCRSMHRASYVGFLTGDDKNKLLKESTALVVPSVWWEALGLVLYEAYDYGKPVLAARSGGIVDHVEDRVTGWLHEPGNSDMLASHMLEAISSRETTQSMGVNGRKLLLDRSANVWIDEFNDFASSIIAAHSSSSNQQSSILNRQSSISPSSSSSSSSSPSSDLRPSTLRPSDREASSSISLSIYLADQNPGHDRSFGISRMSQVVLEALQAGGRVRIQTITSKTSQQAPVGVGATRMLPWGTRSKWVRLLTDHIHPLFTGNDFSPDLYYFPKGYLPWLSGHCQPSVVTIHDTIIQYDKDHYPKWRVSRDYAYWEMMLKHTLRNAGTILTVSESSKRQISAFIERHALPKKEIHVTYEPCLYETIPQPVAPTKKNHVIHLASCEPHKRSAHLIRWWHEAESQGRDLPMLHLIGQVPDEVLPLLASTQTIVKRPFLEDRALQAAYQEARALILPSEIEGFGLPALEAYYLGTPVCYVKETSVEEILGVATKKGGFTLDDPSSLFTALDEIIAMSPEEIHQCGLKLRETYAAKKVAEKMIEVFQECGRKVTR